MRDALAKGIRRAAALVITLGIVGVTLLILATIAVGAWKLFCLVWGL